MAVSEEKIQERSRRRGRFPASILLTGKCPNLGRDSISCWPKIGEEFSSSVEVCRKTFPARNFGQPQPSRVVWISAISEPSGAELIFLHFLIRPFCLRLILPLQRLEASACFCGEKLPRRILQNCYSGKKKAHKHNIFLPMTLPVTGGSPDREARDQRFMCYPRNPRNINLLARIPDREDRWPGRPDKVLCAKVLCAFSAP